MRHFVSRFVGCILLSIVMVTVGVAQTTPWQTEVEANLGITQSQYSDNWQGGAASGFAWVSSLNARTQKQLSASFHWKHTLKLAFGQTHNQDVNTKDWYSPVKSNDVIDYETVLKLTKGWFVDPVFAGRVESQFLDQSDPTKTRNFNPIRISEMVGASKTLMKTEKSSWDARLGAVARQLLNDAYVDAANPVPHSKTISDAGIIFDSDFKAPLNDRISFASKLTLIKALMNSESDKLKGLVNENYWQEVDINWDNTLTGKLTSYLSMHLNAQFLYDKEIDLAGRFKQTLSLGLTYILKS